MKTLLVLAASAALLAAIPAQAQYRNLEISPNGSGGVQGTYGNENFDIDGSSSGAVSGQVGGRQSGVVTVRPSRTPGNVGATQRRCYVDGNGNAYCQ